MCVFAKKGNALVLISKLLNTHTHRLKNQKPHLKALVLDQVVLHHHDIVDAAAQRRVGARVVAANQQCTLVVRAV